MVCRSRDINSIADTEEQLFSHTALNELTPSFSESFKACFSPKPPGTSL